MSRHQDVIVYEHVVERLVETVPELREAYERELEWWRPQAPGPHVLFEDVLNPLINELLGSTNPESERALKRIFDFIERLATLGDDRVRDLVSVAICAPLVGDPLRLSRARHFMRRATLKTLATVQRG